MQSSVTRTEPSSSSLKDVVEVILDKGMVIDAYVRISLVGIELITIDARIIIASLETYMKYAEKLNRLKLKEQSDAANIGSLFGAGGSDDGDSDDSSSSLTQDLINSVVDKATPN